MFVSKFVIYLTQIVSVEYNDVMLTAVCGAIIAI